MANSFTTITIEIDYPLATIKQAYRNYYGHKGKVLKADLAVWLAGMAQADMEDYIDFETEDEENERLTRWSNEVLQRAKQIQP